MHQSTRYLYSAARRQESDRPFCLTVSLTHPHDPYTIHREYWDRYEGEHIPLPAVKIPQQEQDPHSQRLLKVCDLWGREPADEAVVRARRAYFGAVSYVDDNVGEATQGLRRVWYGRRHDCDILVRSWRYARRERLVVCNIPLFATYLTHLGTKCHGSRRLQESHS